MVMKVGPYNIATACNLWYSSVCYRIEIIMSYCIVQGIFIVMCLLYASCVCVCLGLFCRRLFNLFAYTLLLYNIATGLWANLLRVIKAFSCTLLIMPRLDKVVFVQPFDRFDSG